MLSAQITRKAFSLAEYAAGQTKRFTSGREMQPMIKAPLIVTVLSDISRMKMKTTIEAVAVVTVTHEVQLEIKSRCAACTAERKTVMVYHRVRNRSTRSFF